MDRRQANRLSPTWVQFVLSIGPATNCFPRCMKKGRSLQVPAWRSGRSLKKLRTGPALVGFEEDRNARCPACILCSCFSVLLLESVDLTFDRRVPPPHTNFTSFAVSPLRLPPLSRDAIKTC